MTVVLSDAPPGHMLKMILSTLAKGNPDYSMSTELFQAKILQGKGLVRRNGQSQSVPSTWVTNACVLASCRDTTAQKNCLCMRTFLGGAQRSLGLGSAFRRSIAY